jgi:formate transporter
MEKRMLIPAEVCDETVNVGIKKGAKSTLLQTTILGLFAGAFISMGAFAAAMSSHSIENIGLAKLVAGIIFPVGLILVLMAGAELFTGNSLLIIAFLEKRITLKQILRNWVVVWCTNFIGAIFIAYLLFNSGLFDTNAGKLGGYAIKIAATKAGLSFNQAFASGILCNFIVTLAVWASYSAKDVVSKIFVSFFPIMAFVISGFEHSVANMYYFTVGLLLKSNPLYVENSHVAAEKLAKLDIAHVFGNLLPVTLGNIVGGALFVGAAYWLVFKKSTREVYSNKKVINM